MLIGSKLPPHHADTTYFSSGRAAFAYLVGQLTKPTRVYLPTFVCWSLVSAMERLFPDREMVFYPVDEELNCLFPPKVEAREALVFIHYFGHANKTPLPEADGWLFEDQSHSYMSQIPTVGDYVFGSYRKIMKVGDGGFLKGFYNPVYEPARKLDTWLRYEALDWRDIREAENMLDRQWSICDISSQSLAILLQANEDVIRAKRRKNERFLAENLNAGETLFEFRESECPMLHPRKFPSKDERDSLRAFLAARGVFTSIHWPTHDAVRRAAEQVDISGTCWLEEHLLCFPVSDDYNENDMEYICNVTDQWQHSGA